MIDYNQQVKVKITKGNIEHYKSTYPGIQCGDTLYVKVADLSHGSNALVKVICDYCGTELTRKYKDYINSHHDSYACCHCRQRATSDRMRIFRRENIYNRSISFCEQNGYELLTDKEDIDTVHSMVRYRCPKHGIHETHANLLIYGGGHGCPECAIEKNADNQRKTQDDVTMDFQKHGGILLNPNEYIEWNEKNLRVLCPICGNEFTTSYCAFVAHHGQYCPNCTSTRSKGELRIKLYLDSNNVDYQMQYRFDGCRRFAPLPFDFYIPSYNMCIEYDGEGHYLPVNFGGISNEEAEQTLIDLQKRDEIKTKFCQDNGICLLRISYYDFDNIEAILEEQFHTKI